MDNICCTCFGEHIPSKNDCNKKNTKCKDGCFSLGTIIANDCDNPVYSCGTEVTVPFSCYCIPCEEPIIEVTRINNSLELLSITKEELKVKVLSTAKPGDKLEVDFLMVCKGDCEVKSEYGKVVLFVESRCKGLNCSKCDECTGECVPEVKIEKTNPEVKIVKYNG